MTDPIEIDRDDGSRLALSRAEVVRAMAAMRAADVRRAVVVCAACELRKCECAREGRRDG